MRFSSLKRTVLTVALAGVVAGPALALDAFLDIPSIPGESTDQNFRRKIDVLGFGFALSSDGCGGDVQLGPLTFNKWFGPSSLLMLEAANSGTNLGTVTLSTRRGNGIALTQYVLSDARLIAGVVNGETEDAFGSWGLSYSAIQVSHTPWSMSGGLEPAVIGTATQGVCP